MTGANETPQCPGCWNNRDSCAACGGRAVKQRAAESEARRTIVSFQVIQSKSDVTPGVIIVALDNTGRLSFLPSLNKPAWVDLPALDAEEPKP